MRFPSLLWAVPFGALVSIGACGGSTESSSSAASSNDGGADEPPARRVTKRPPDAAPPPTWCDRAGSHAFCIDFDDDDGLGRFDEIFFGNDNAHRDDYGVERSDRSPPHALYLRGQALPTPDGGQDPLGPFSGMVGVKKLPKTTATKVHLAFDLRVAVNDEYVSVFELVGRTKDQHYAAHVSLELMPDKSYLMASLGGEIGSLPAIAMNRWVHVDVVADQVARTATLSFDGTPAGSSPYTGDLSSSSETTLYLGISRTAPSGAYDVSYDDLVLDFE